MAASNVAIFPQTIKNHQARMQNSDSTNKVTLATAGAQGSVLNAINISSTDTSARTLNIYVTIGGVDYLLTTINIPLNSGNTTSAVPIDLLRNAQFPANARDSQGNLVFVMASGTVLKAAATVAITAAKFIDFFAQGVDY